nr:hypothetical protein [Listeria grayi]
MASPFFGDKKEEVECVLIIDKIQNYILRRKQVIHEKKILAIFHTFCLQELLLQYKAGISKQDEAVVHEAFITLENIGKIWAGNIVYDKRYFEGIINYSKQLTREEKQNRYLRDCHWEAYVIQIIVPKTFYIEKTAW